MCSWVSGKYVRALLLLALLVILARCAGPPNPSDERSSLSSRIHEDHVYVDAYLFDTKVIRNGKPTTIRLEVFHADSVVALNGRAYLGKGALKGWLADDSIAVYFPGSNEYLYNSLSGALEPSDCAVLLEELKVLRLFGNLPDSIDLNDSLIVEANYEHPEHPRFTLSREDCSWRLEVGYDRRGRDWRLKRLSFDNGNLLRITARRREYRGHLKVPSSRFQLHLPLDARPLAR